MRSALDILDRASAHALPLAAFLLLLACQDEPTAPAPVPARAFVTLTGPVVNSAADPGDGTCDVAECTLREAIAAAYAGDVITFDPALDGATIGLGGSQLMIDRDLTIAGPGAGKLTIHGRSASRVLAVNAGVTATVTGLTITGGNTHDGAGGGGVLNQGTLTLEHCALTDNFAGLGSAATTTGALRLRHCTIDFNTGFNTLTVTPAGTLTLERSTLRRNLAVGSMIDVAGSASILSSTISGNESVQHGIITGTAVIIRNSTLTRNTSNFSGAVLHDITSVSVSSSIVANNTGWDCSGSSVASTGDNIFGFTLCSTAAGDLLVNRADIATRVLAPLADNGGATWTHALHDPTVTGFANPALDAGSCVASSVVADQRGEPRPADLPAIANAHDGCDIGAFEMQLPPPCTLEELVERVDALRDDGGLSEGQAHALRRKLEQVERLVGRGKTADALVVLAGFIQQVSDLETDGLLTADEAADLASCAEDVVEDAAG